MQDQHPSSSGDVSTVLRDAQALIDTAERQMARMDEDLRTLGLDPQKVRAFAASRNDPKSKAEVERLVAEDLAEVQREVDQAKARLSFEATSRKGGKKPRPMV